MTVDLKRPQNLRSRAECNHWMYPSLQLLTVLYTMPRLQLLHLMRHWVKVMMLVSEQGLLDAMDGIVMILDGYLRIVRVGRTNWQMFLDADPAPNGAAQIPAHQDVLDHAITQFIAGDTVRATLADLFHSVLTGRRRVVQFGYRCDSPTLRRDMRLSVRPIATNGEVRHLLYQSVVLSVEQRPAIPLFGVPVAQKDGPDILTLCSICARVAWPIDAPSHDQQWIEPAEYYRRGGAEVVLLSHGFCIQCFAELSKEI